MSNSTRVDRAKATPEFAPWAAFGGVVGVVMLGSSFLLLPNAPALTVPLGQLVDYAKGHHALLLSTAWLEAFGSALYVGFLVVLANTDAAGRRTAGLLTTLCGAAVLAVGLFYAICLIAMAESSKMGGTQLETTATAYGLWAACEHAFLLAPPVFLPLGFALRGSSTLGSRFANTAVALGCASIVLGLIGLFSARPQNAGAAGIAINALIGVEVIWVVAAAASLHRRRAQLGRSRRVFSPGNDISTLLKARPQYDSALPSRRPPRTRPGAGQH